MNKLSNRGRVRQERKKERAQMLRDMKVTHRDEWPKCFLVWPAWMNHVFVSLRLLQKNLVDDLTQCTVYIVRCT